MFYLLKLDYVKIVIVNLIIWILNNFYGHITSYIQLATSKCIPSFTNHSKFKIIPGWNDYVKESYAIFRDALKWLISNNRPRFGIIYGMRTTRAQFK